MKSNYSFISGILALQIFFLLSLKSNSQSPGWTWARNYGTISYYTEIGQPICNDGAGNVLLAGQYFGNTIAFGSTTLTNTSFQSFADSDAYLVKQDAAGNVLWAKNFGCSGNDAIYGVCVDASNNIYITGMFIESSGNIFGMVLGTFTLNSMGGGGDMFVAKLDPNGNVLWAKGAGGNYTEQGLGICTDAGGNVYVAASSSSQSFNIGNLSFSTNGASDFFVAKYSTGGNVMWVKQGGGQYFDYANAIAVDAAGDIVIAGKFQGSMTLGAQTLTNSVPMNSMDAFIAKYSASGTVIWATQTSGTNDDVIRALSTDPNNNIVVAGNFRSPVLTCGTVTLANAGSHDMFVAKYNAAGSIQWAKGHGGTGTDDAYSVDTDASGNIYVTGGFYSPTLVIGSTSLSNSNSSDDIFVCKYNAAGNEQWALSASGTTDQFGNGIICDPNGGLYVTGYFRSNTLTLGSTVLTNTDSPYSHVFLGKLDQNILPGGIQDVMGQNSLEIFPNPAQDRCVVKLQSAGNSFLKLYAANGALVKELTANHLQNGEWIVETGELPNGIYLLQITSNDHMHNGKLIVHH
ncbi:MAG: T9SS type A sorting domain-containing protein [Bacteroidota bacterium]